MEGEIYFIEQYNSPSTICQQTSTPLPLCYLDRQLEITKSHETLTTIAVWKIKKKEKHSEVYLRAMENKNQFQMGVLKTSDLELFEGLLNSHECKK